MLSWLSSARGRKEGTQGAVAILRDRKQKTGVSAPNAKTQSPCSFSCFKPLVGYLIVCLKRHLTEGREGARWPWLLSRPDRALRCPHGWVVGAMVMSTESVQTPFTVGLLWHSLIF